uniref:WYL domain-containing protein n=1 Tax=Cyanothece sp. (strain PCC 7425 / ATCC 29141) TaxID=395961 RepID=B8HZK8_CYAP4
MESLTGMNSEILRQEMAKAPFSTVHRSIRQDLSLLAQLQWLRAGERGLFIRQPEAKLPHPGGLSKAELEPSSQSRDLYWLLQEIAFLQPNLSRVINTLWEHHSAAREWQAEHTRNTQRLFLHLDFLSEEIAEQVEDYQAGLEELWQQGDRPIRFIYQLAQAKRQVKVLVYPVCLHYARRAKYLSAYGIDPYGQENWHNYRLDRIRSSQLDVLDWQHPDIPDFLLKLKQQNQLPTPEEVREKLEEAWGLDFYRPAQLLILRFPADFARWYVTEKFNRLKLEKLSYPQLVKRIRKEILDSQEQQTLLELVHQRQSSDSNNNYVYFCAQVRVGDINVTMRLRDWRPQGEVIAPLQLREQMKREALTELAHYQNGSN